jgi:O-antigen/teichoic acid export membrane protein
VSATATATAPAAGVGAVLRGVAQLSVGTTLVQLMVVVGQTLLVVWLSPQQFGLWATATASMAVLTGLVNFGEVNGYLAGEGTRLREARRMIWRLNAVLVLGAAAIAAGYAVAGRPELAILVVLTGLNIPLLGESNLLYAAYVRQRRNGHVVRAQVVSALVRTAVAVAIAWLTGSAIAFAVAMLLQSVVMLGLLAPRTRRWLDEARPRTARIGWRQRATWAVQAVCQLLPTQVDFLVVSVVGGTTLLGIYFFAYQATVGLSALVAKPLVKSVLAALAAHDERTRPALAEKLMSITSAGTGAAAAVAVGAITLVAGLLPSEWQAAAPVIGILLASIPARFLTALSDTVQMAGGFWWRSTALNVVDAVGTAAAALTAITGNLMVLAVAIVAWKIIIMAVRVWQSPLGLPARGRAMIVGPAALVAGALTAGVLIGRTSLWLLTAGVLAASVVRIAVVWRGHRLVAAPREVVAAESSRS